MTDTKIPTVNCPGVNTVGDLGSATGPLLAYEVLTGVGRRVPRMLQ